jgi:putative transcriptional regulator
LPVLSIRCAIERARRFVSHECGDYNAGVSEPNVNLTHHFLIAMPAMVDPNFSRTLTYVCEHNEQGALGIIVNRPLDMTLPMLFERISIALDNHGFDGMPVYFGGPVQTDRGFVLHRPAGEWQATLAVNEDIGLTSSRDILEAVGSQGQPWEILVTLGYAGWAAGQLEHELTQNAWLTVQADPQIIFALPAEERLPAAMQLLGVDYAKLSEVAGHA